MDHTQAPGAAMPSSAGGWYAGISGEPVGPVDLDYLQGEVDAERVTAKTLVWREGQGEWKPLNTFPELRALLAKKKAPVVPDPGTSAPLALTKPKEATAPGAPSGALATQAMNPFDQAKVKKESKEEHDDSVAALAALAAGSTVKADAPPPGAVEAASPTPSPKAAPAPVPVPTPAPAPVAAPTPATKPGSIEDLAAEMGVDTAAKGGTLPDAEITPAGVPAERKKGVHPMAWAFVAMAAAFGGVSAWFLFGQSESGDPKPIASVVPTSGGPEAGPPQPGRDGSDPKKGATPSPEPGGDSGDTSNGAVGRTPTGGPAPRTTGSGTTKPASEDDDGGKPEPPDPKAPPEPCNPDDPFCSPAVDGPSATNGDGNGSKSGAGLSPDQAQATVGRYRGSLMRRCRSLVAPGKSATVGATITIGPSGAVQSAGVSGGKGHPGLASCVRQRIMNWRFPASGGTSTVNVSFKFL